MIRPLALALVLTALVTRPAAAQAAASMDAAARGEFLRTARVVEAVPIGKGITRPMRLTLSDGRVTHDAAFQAVDEKMSELDRRQGRARAGERDFVDSWRYNVGAYEIAHLLGIGHMIPVTVERDWNGRRGALSWWVDDVLMDEEERQRTDAVGPDSLALVRQQQTMSTFAALVHDVDRNKGNVLYTKDWRLVMIDFTRAFRQAAALPWPTPVGQIERAFFDRLERFTSEEARSAAGRWITTFEIDAMLRRRDMLLAHFRVLAAARGEKAVFY